MVQKVKAAVDARRDGDLQIIARTDARAVEGLDRAIARAHAYIEAGADVAFVEAPTSLAELARVTREIKAPHVANIVFGGKTPDPGQAELAKLGFSLVLYANAALQAAVKAAFDVLGALKRDGSLDGVADKIASFEERQRVVQNRPGTRWKPSSAGRAGSSLPPLRRRLCLRREGGRAMRPRF